MSKMMTLIKKDWRVNRVPVVGGALLILAPYVVSAIQLLTNSDWAARGGITPMWALAAGAGGGLSAIMGAVFGGVAFATERSDRSANFLAMLPVSRVQILTSKLIVAVLCLAMFFAFNLMVLLIAYCVASPREIASFYSVTMMTLGGMAWSALFGLGLFGVAWMLSSFLSSPAISASAALGVIVGLIAAVATGVSQRYTSNDASRAWSISAAAALGVVGFVIGTVHYLRRVEP
jgi:ABC-type transport system involved in multi-copper enzyme maturation permease subunit